MQGKRENEEETVKRKMVIENKPRMREIITLLRNTKCHKKSLSWDCVPNDLFHLHKECEESGDLCWERCLKVAKLAKSVFDEEVLNTEEANFFFRVRTVNLNKDSPRIAGYGKLRPLAI